MAVLFSTIAVSFPIRFANSMAVSGPVSLVVGVNGDKGSSVPPASLGVLFPCLILLQMELETEL
jgi:hypothetical protein